MQLENIWTAIMALILGIGIGITFLPTMGTIIGINDPEVRIFLGVIVSITGFLALVNTPIDTVTQDDTGRTS